MIGGLELANDRALASESLEHEVEGSLLGRGVSSGERVALDLVVLMADQGAVHAAPPEASTPSARASRRSRREASGVGRQVTAQP